MKAISSLLVLLTCNLTAHAATPVNYRTTAPPGFVEGFADTIHQVESTAGQAHAFRVKSPAIRLNFSRNQSKQDKHKPE